MSVFVTLGCCCVIAGVEIFLHSECSFFFVGGGIRLIRLVIVECCFSCLVDVDEFGEI